MSIRIKDQYATVWSVEDKGNYVAMRISTSKKNQDGTYTNSNWFANAVGKAKDIAKTLKEKDRITIVGGEISNVYNKEKQQSFFNVVIFELSKNDSVSQSGTSTFTELNEDDDIPF